MELSRLYPELSEQELVFDNRYISDLKETATYIRQIALKNYVVSDYVKNQL